ncbi:hypothetical protein K1T73_05760 [Roseovarius sp. SCSIO 43702]|uniref:DUF6638 family protein n=1 Tax=Roseovarius sp. SCSIO 43702 TaxID=2823043 RepID=UPI001C72AA35|nr:DUF6638 family protein [Roseovarius sp. SCSIO 43702]QYX57893.1 hypothetical protein K1T73_05760 [Roseovarius sp. SCSIO 43702]
MNRLIRTGLMFGNLIHVASPALVERYNRALEHLTGRTTALTDFYIDISGYSPEVGHEFGDHDYLNHAGVNRQFILLTTQQKTAPLLNAKFSTSRGVLRQFIEANEAALFALTTRDAVAGELANSVYDMATPARLFDIRRVTVEADTTGGALRQARALEKKIDRFLNEQDAWFDDVLIAEMIGLAQETGDIVRNPVTLAEMSFEQRNFWTAHFGGAYIFQAVPHPALVTPGDPATFDGAPIAQVLGFDDRNRIARFLEDNALAEPIVKARGIDAGAILRQKMDFIVVDALADSGLDLAGLTRIDMRRLARQNAERLPQEFHALAALVNWAENDGPWPAITSEHPAYFHTLRAADTPDADLVNMLLAELAPKDIRQLFICHKQAFYDRYRTWSETKKEYVVDFLVNEYQVDKLGTRKALFGHDAPMEDPAPPPPVSEATIARVGPWGPVRR